MKQLLLIAVCLVVATDALSQQSTPSKYGLPLGPWAVSCGPRMTPGPLVDLYKTGSSVETGMTVSDVWLENRSTRNVTGVKIAWRIYDISNKNNTLLKGETPKFLAVSLLSGEKRKVNYPVISFARIYRQLLHGKSQLDGNYKIEVWVSRVSFSEAPPREDGSATSFNIKKVNWKSHAATGFIEVMSEPALDDALGCQKQECTWKNEYSCYRCTPLDGSTCRWFNCTYCENGRCPGYIE